MNCIIEFSYWKGLFSFFPKVIAFSILSHEVLCIESRTYSLSGNLFTYLSDARLLFKGSIAVNRKPILLLFPFDHIYLTLKVMMVMVVDPLLVQWKWRGLESAVKIKVRASHKHILWVHDRRSSDLSTISNAANTTIFPIFYDCQFPTVHIEFIHLFSIPYLFVNEIPYWDWSCCV